MCHYVCIIKQCVSAVLLLERKQTAHMLTRDTDDKQINKHCNAHNINEFDICTKCNHRLSLHEWKLEHLGWVEVYVWSVG